MTDSRQLSRLVRPHLERLRNLRRDLHRYPELSYEEHQTADMVERELSALGLSPRRLAGTGVVADVGGDAPRIALRADLDALPIDEKNDFAHRSTTPGVMHACGHDGHTAILLGVATILSGAVQALGEAGVRLIFQPAEEGGAGAARMIEQGVLEGVSTIYGLHNWPVSPFGTVGVISGPIMASSAVFEERVIGRGGHGSQPHHAIDPIVTAAQIITALQTILSREVDPREPAVVSVCTVAGGSARNVIPDEASFAGTIRAFDDKRTDWLGERVGAISTTLAEALGCRVEHSYERQYPAVVNHRNEATLVAEVAEEILGTGAATSDGLPVMGAEDFSYYLRERAGAFFFLGSQHTEGSPSRLHSSTFDFDDALIEPGVSLFLRIVERSLDRSLTIA